MRYSDCQSNKPEEWFRRGVCYDDPHDPRIRPQHILDITYYVGIQRVIIDSIVKLCAYELVELDQEYQEKFEKIVGEKVTKEKIVRWLLAAMIDSLELGLTIHLAATLTSDVLHNERFAPELTDLIRGDKDGQIYKESIELLFQELVKIAEENRPALLPRVYAREELTLKSIYTNVHLRLSDMIIKSYSYAFLAVSSDSVAPKDVKSVEAGLLPSLMGHVLRTRGKGAPEKPGRKTQLQRFAKVTDMRMEIGEFLSEFARKHDDDDWVKMLPHSERFRYLSNEYKRHHHDPAILMEAAEALYNYQKDTSLSKSDREHAVMPLSIAQIVASLELGMRKTGRPHKISTLNSWYREAKNPSAQKKRQSKKKSKSL